MRISAYLIQFHRILRIIFEVLSELFRLSPNTADDVIGKIEGSTAILASTELTANRKKRIESKTSFMFNKNGRHHILISLRGYVHKLKQIKNEAVNSLKLSAPILDDGNIASNPQNCSLEYCNVSGAAVEIVGALNEVSRYRQILWNDDRECANIEDVNNNQALETQNQNASLVSDEYFTPEPVEILPPLALISDEVSAPALNDSLAPVPPLRDNSLELSRIQPQVYPVINLKTCNIFHVPDGALYDKVDTLFFKGFVDAEYLYCINESDFIRSGNRNCDDRAASVQYHKILSVNGIVIQRQIQLKSGLSYALFGAAFFYLFASLFALIWCVGKLTLPRPTRPESLPSKAMQYPEERADDHDDSEISLLDIYSAELPTNKKTLVTVENRGFSSEEYDNIISNPMDPAIKYRQRNFFQPLREQRPGRRASFRRRQQDKTGQGVDDSTTTAEVDPAPAVTDTDTVTDTDVDAAVRSIEIGRKKCMSTSLQSSTVVMAAANRPFSHESSAGRQGTAPAISRSCEATIEGVIADDQIVKSSRSRIASQMPQTASGRMIESLEQLIDKVEGKMAAKDAAVVSMSAQLQDLQLQLSQKSAAVDLLAAVLERYRTELTDEEQLILVRDVEIERRADDLLEMKPQLSYAMEEIAALKSQLMEKEVVASSYQSEVAMLRSELQEKDAALSTRVAEIEKQGAMLAEKEQLLLARDREIENQQESMREKDSTLTQALDDLSVLRLSLSQKEVAVSSYRSEVTRLRYELREKDAALSTRVAEIEKQGAMFAEKEQLLLARDREIENQQESMREKDSTLTQALDDLSVLRLSLSEKEDAEFSLHGVVDGLRCELSEKDAVLHLQGGRIERQEAELEAKEQLLLARDKEIEKCTASVKEKESKLLQAMEDIEELKSYWTEQEATVSSLRLEVASLRSELTAKEAAFKAEAAAALAEREQLLLARDSEIASHEDSMREKERELSLASQEITTFRSSLSQKEGELLSSHANIESLRLELSEKAAALDRVAAVIAKRRSDLADKEKSLLLLSPDSEIETKGDIERELQVLPPVSEQVVALGSSIKIVEFLEQLTCKIGAKVEEKNASVLLLSSELEGAKERLRVELAHQSAALDSLVKEIESS